MMRTRIWTRLLLGITLLLAIGCGKQDLYEFPDSPYPKIGQLALPSANEGVAVLGDYAFVAGGEAGLHVVDISDPANPELKVTLNTTKYAESIEVVRTYRNGQVVDIAHVVEGTEGITSYDITDPLNPTDLEQGTTAVDGNRMAIVEPEDPADPYLVFLAENWKGVRVFTSNELSPGVLDYGGVFSYTLGYAKGLAPMGDWLYVADNEMGLVVMDASLLVLGEFGVESSVDTPGNALDLAIEGNYVYVADGVEGIHCFDITVPDQPELVGSLDLPAYSRSIIVRDGLAFIAAATGGVHIVDVSDPTDPSYAGNVPSGYASEIAITEDGLVLVSDYDDGLYILSGDSFLDNQAPGTAQALSTEPYSFERVDLHFLAGGDNGYYGYASSYDIRVSAAPITTDEEFDAATPIAQNLTPRSPLMPEVVQVSGLDPETEYHFAIKVHDEAGRVSGLSESATGSTRPLGILLQDPAISADAGTIDTTFSYEVVCLNSSPNDPTVRTIVIDGISYDMEHISGDHLTGAIYRYETLLGVGEHNYRFYFENDQGDFFETELLSGPVVGLEMLQMGSPLDESGRDEDESIHIVCLSQGLVADLTEVTQAEWTALMGAHDFDYVGDNLPAHNIDWYQALEYCNALSIDDGFTPAYTIDGYSVSWNQEADGWRLPTEAEWEWLARAGAETAFCGGGITETGYGLDPVLDQYGWYGGNVNPAQPQPVGQKLANDFDLFDMHGNVAEWCWDWYAAYEAGPLLDPAGPEIGELKVIRGGDWFFMAKICRSASRETFPPSSADNRVGFRVVRTLIDE